MRGLSEEQRAENIKGSIAVASDFDGFDKKARVAVLDDFYTTGSTARECIRALEDSGAEDIIFIAFASRYADRRLKESRSKGSLERFCYCIIQAEML